VIACQGDDYLRMKEISSLRLVVMLGGLFAAQTHSQLPSLVNGQFDQPPQPGANQFETVGSTFITGWTVVGTLNHNVHYVAAGSLMNGTAFLDLSGSGNGAGGAGIAQSFSTDVGMTYRINFDAENGSLFFNQGHMGEAYTGNALSVVATGGAVEYFSIPASPTSDPEGIYSLSYTFKATSPTTILTFMDASGYDSNAGWIDNVTVSVVPEPYEYGLVGIAAIFCSAGWHRFARRSKALA
jgi:hypothetical protein